MNAFQKLKAEFSKRCPWGPALGAKWDELIDKRRNGASKVDGDKLKAAQTKFTSDCVAFGKELDAEIDALLPKVGKQALALAGERPSRSEDRYDNPSGDKNYAIAAQMYRHKLQTALAADPSPAPAPKVLVPAATAPTPAPKPTAAPQAVLTPEAVGKAVISTTTHPDPKISKPATAALQTITHAAQQAQRPIFAFLSGFERSNLSAEFDRLGGLTARSHKLFMYRRQQYCERHRLTPEQVFGQPHAQIPAIVETAAEIKGRETAVQKLDAAAFAKFASLDRRMAECAGDSASVARLQGAKAKAAQQWANDRTNLQTPAHLRK